MLASFAFLLFFASATIAAQTTQALPVSKIYGVNIGNFLVLEPWMMPNEWLAMGGESCADCSTCVGSEGALALKLGQNGTDVVMQQHWDTWFTNADIDKIKAAGLNTVRIPLGYWLVESLVDRTSTTEPPFARGGMAVLKSRMRYLASNGINVVFDLHALPGVAAIKQMFAGLCTTDVQFYQNSNYERALIWAGIMTAMSHLDADFAKVFSIQAANEPVQNAAQTPGLGQYYTDFVQVTRAIEKSLGIFFTGSKLPTGVKSSLSVSQTILALADKQPGLGTNARSALKKIQPLLLQHAAKYNFRITKVYTKRKPLFVNFQDAQWQYGDRPNPYHSADGPATYDNHLYYSFSNVAKNATETGYLQHICNLGRPATATSLKNNPLWFGEWSLATQWDFSDAAVKWRSPQGAPATDAFLKQWADAQKSVMASKTAGWIFWSFKIENGNPYKRNWDYFEALRLGYFKQNASQVFNANICKPYTGKS
ncbi:glycoside hydrolase family 5 protein [Auriculariales sp. MPI-PUGE-AT-0066]|nr:glycoside hydrolase family 5 protein [Auriculariales sp. MPI-PUGE-AT-0066]